MLGGSKPPEALGDYTGFLMNWCAVRSRGAFAAELDRLGLRPQEFADPGLTQQALVEATGVDPSSMVQLLDGLERLRLAKRLAHPTDRRKRAIHLTSEGRATLDRARVAATRVGEATFAPLTDGERAQLHGLLRKLAGLDAG
jgi:MarR family transcriptional regulator, lower aerobic nicotinate degradation pathway regulator